MEVIRLRIRSGRNRTNVSITIQGLLGKVQVTLVSRQFVVKGANSIDECNEYWPKETNYVAATSSLINRRRFLSDRIISFDEKRVCGGNWRRSGCLQRAKGSRKHGREPFSWMKHDAAWWACEGSIHCPLLKRDDNFKETWPSKCVSQIWGMQLVKSMFIPVSQ